MRKQSVTRLGKRNELSAPRRRRSGSKVSKVLGPDFDRRRVPIKYPPGLVVSAAQNLEDVLLNRVFEGKRNGCYLDIGAGDPNIDSVTRWFYSIGWRGCNVEPNPRFEAVYQRERPEDINLTVGVAAGIGSLTYYRVDRNEVTDGWGLSSFDLAAIERARAAGFAVTELVVPTMTLNEIVGSHLSGRPIDFLKIDVEGYEKTVLQSADWSIVRPSVVVIEATEPMSVMPVHDQWEGVLLGAGYVFAMFDGVNAYYVSTEASEALLPQFNAGVNLFDAYRRIDPREY